MIKFEWQEHRKLSVFYKQHGYAILKNQNSSFLNETRALYDLFTSQDLSTLTNTAFLNREGVARHRIDILRQYPLARRSFDDQISGLVREIADAVSLRGRLCYTHCKLSFKIPGMEVTWWPHQDAGYKAQGEATDGFALFWALEDMDESNGTLELYEGSHRAGILFHSRKTENVRLGDSQMEVSDIKSFPKITLNLNRGDIVIFSPFMVHGSGVSKTISKRLALIAEVESLQSLRLDDYGKKPIFIDPRELSISLSIYLTVISYCHPIRYWFLIRNIEGLNQLARKLLEWIRKL